MTPRDHDPLVDLRADTTVDAIVVGAGFGGLYATHAMRALGFSVQGFEAGASVGGTWFFNRYPGARCDIESLEYSFQFDETLAQDWEWTERYATQPELLAYAEHIADRFDLRRLYDFDTRVQSATFDDAQNCWHVQTEAGRQYTATWLFMATGGIAIPKTPDFVGKDTFEGEATHTAQWPVSGIEVAGKRVAIIGTGSSAIQAIPELAAEAGELFVLQRSPNYVVPSQNSQRDLLAEADVRASYEQFRRDNDRYSNGFGSRWSRSEGSAFAVEGPERDALYAQSWDTGGFSFLFTFGDLTSDTDAAETAARFIRKQIASTVDDPEVAALLSPQHIFGCRRLCVGTNYYETFNRHNVTLVDLSSRPIEAITPTGVRYGDEHLAIDVLIYATGFEDQAASLKNMSIVGTESSLADTWRQQPSNYLGVAVAGFPNMFIVNLPGSPSVATNMITNAEYTVDWMTSCIQHAQAHGYDRVEADPDAQHEWTRYVDSIGDGLVYEYCHNLYTAIDDTGRRYVLPHLGVPAYLDEIRAAAANNYRGIRFSSPADRNPLPTHHVTEELV